MVEATRHAVAQAGGRIIPADNLHVTLAFLGNVAADRLSDALHAADAVAAEPFTLTLDRIEPWRRSQVLVLSAAVVPSALGSLVEQLRINLLQQKFKLTDELYRPHVTLLRRLPAHYRRVEDIDPLEWQVADFVLVDSVTTQEGSRYSIRHRWPLA
jgi:2'-5' RNA ligase